MLKPTVRFACLALLLFAASASPVIARAAQQDSPLPQPDPLPPITQVMSTTPLDFNATQQDSPLPQPDPLPPLPK
jgi:hypothetical protein